MAPTENRDARPKETSLSDGKLRRRTAKGRAVLFAAAGTSSRGAALCSEARSLPENGDVPYFLFSTRRGERAHQPSAGSSSATKSLNAFTFAVR
jgi:hypothetical protein